MHIILAYDVKKKRAQKILKICRKYLVHIQKSVFEGQITQKQLHYLKREILSVVVTKEDSVVIYQLDSPRFVVKEQIGKIEENEKII